MRRGGDPPARAVRGGHGLRDPGRAHARVLPWPGRLADPARHAAPRAGRGLYGLRLRARHGQARRLRPDHRRGRGERRHRDRDGAPRLAADADPVERHGDGGRGAGPRRAARPARSARLHAHDLRGVDRRARSGRPAGRVRRGVRGADGAPAATRPHQRADRRALPARRRRPAAALSSRPARRTPNRRWTTTTRRRTTTTRRQTARAWPPAPPAAQSRS